MASQVRPRSRIALPGLPHFGARLRSASTTVLAIGVVAVAIVLATWINFQARLTADRVSHSIEVRERAARFLGHVRDAETGQRGYLLTGNERFLTPFTSGRAAALPELGALEKLVEADPRQRETVMRARELTESKFAELDKTIAMVDAGRRESAIEGVRQGLGVVSMDALRSAVQQIQIVENVRLVALNRNEERRRLLASAGIVVALAALAFAAWQQLKVRQRRAVQLTTSNVRLEQMVAERTRQLENERMRIEALLRDVNHRVGNNLAMVSALLNVQTRQTQEPTVRTALAQAQSRIQAIAAGQRRLRLDLETDEIDARPYMEDLLAEIGKAAEGRPIKIDLEMDDIRLPGRDAVSFVVIVNELVTNAIKHAFPDNIDGRIVVRFGRTDVDGQSAIMMSVEDDGVGLRREAEARGLGQTVIASLLRSMRASMTSEAKWPERARPGCRFTLLFPERADAS